MVNLRLESWSAIAPGMNDTKSWLSWFEDKRGHNLNVADPPRLEQISPLLRRRFTPMGKYAAKAALNVIEKEHFSPTIYASRHGDTALTLSLLKDIAHNEPLSPTSFSLAVHNAVGGLLSIARKDLSPITAIASANNLVLSSLQEAAAQLTCYEKVLCVIYDMPLPVVYRPYCQSLPFPVAIAITLTNHEAYNLRLSMTDESQTAPSLDDEPMFSLIELLCGIKSEISLKSNDQRFSLSRTVA